MLLQLLRFLRGYVDFTAKGKFPERFLNITARYGINLWNSMPSSDGLKATMSVSDYKKIRLIAKKSKVKTKITVKHGLPFLTAKYKDRIGIPIGGIIGIILLIVLSNFIWGVSITGTANVSETHILSLLSEKGIKTGEYKNNIDVQKIEREMKLEVKEIGWMSINITGNVVSVEIMEKAEKPQLNENLTPCNIKAKCDGVITEISARKGTTAVLKGSGVVKGDLLVSGITQTKMNTVQYVRAEAKVFADVISEKELKIPIKYNYSNPTGEATNRTRTFLLWCEMPNSISFNSYDKSIVTQQSENYTLNNVILPIGKKTETTYEMTEAEKSINEKTARKIFENSLLLYEVFERPESTVKSRKYDVKKTKDNYICDIDYIFNENIAQSVEFNVTE